MPDICWAYACWRRKPSRHVQHPPGAKRCDCNTAQHVREHCISSDPKESSTPIIVFIRTGESPRLILLLITSQEHPFYNPLKFPLLFLFLVLSLTTMVSMSLRYALVTAQVKSSQVKSDRHSLTFPAAYCVLRPVIVSHHHGE